MPIDSAFHLFDDLLTLLVVDVLLSGDNAMVIAMASRSLPPVQKRQAMLIGTGGAILLRVLLTLVASALMYVPLLKLVGGVLLVIIAIKLQLDEDDANNNQLRGTPATNLFSAVVTIVTADVVMSLDNVVGLAAVAQGNVLLLFLGLLISVPLLIFGSLFVSNLMSRYPLMVRGGCALLGWIAGDIAVTDAWIADWVNQQSPALTVVIPALTAAFVLLQSRIIGQQRPALATERQRLENTPWIAARVATASQESVASAVPPAPSTETSPAPVVATAPAPQTHPPEPVTAPPPAQLLAPTETTAKVEVGQRVTPTPTPSPTTISRKAFWTGTATLLALSGITAFMVLRSESTVENQRQTYACESSTAKIAYREGAPDLQVTVGHAFATGVVNVNHDIAWGNYDAVSTALGTAPPKHITLLGTQSVVLMGGSFDHVECKLTTPK